MGRKGKQKIELKTNLRIEYKDDPILLEQLISIILLAKRISNKSKEEAEKIQSNSERTKCKKSRLECHNQRENAQSGLTTSRANQWNKTSTT